MTNPTSFEATYAPASEPALSEPTLPEPTSERWRPLRAGLQNLWQFDHTTRFVFHRGRLLLRGRNGAGKTKVIELLLPFLLEGRMDPRRLDPFGSRSRRMHYNLLHEGNREAKSNVGYAWLEFGRLEDGRPRYLTLGAGLRARRSTPQVTSWFFLAHDRRVDRDLDVLEEDRRPRAAPSLAGHLGVDGQVLDSARAYRAAVDRELFGLDGPQYDALLEALLRLRQPHLSERLDPAEVGAVLSESLPPLDTEKVREVAEGFERIDTHRRELAERRQTLEAVRGFLEDYRGYVGTVAAVRATRFLGAHRAVRRAGTRAREAAAALEAARDAHAARQARHEAVRHDLAEVRTRIQTIRTSDAYRAVQQLQEAEERAAAETRRAERAARRATEADAHTEEARARLARTREHLRAKGEDVRTHARAARRAAAAADVADAHAALHAQLDDAPAETDLDAARGLLRATEEAREAAIARLRRENGDVAKQAQVLEREAERLADAQESAREAASAVARAEAEVAAACDAHQAASQAWLEDLAALELDEASREDLAAARPEDAVGVVRRLAAPARERLDRGVARASTALHRTEARRAETQASRDALAALPHCPPETAGWRTAERAARPGAPLYLLMDFDGALDAGGQAGIEAALEAAGLLDAWVMPDGRLLEVGTGDVLAIPRTPVPGRSLADLVRPTPAGGVGAEVVRAVAASIAVPETAPAAAGDGEAWVLPDGRFALGPLAGAATPTRVRYVGEAARAREHACRLAALDAALDDLDEQGRAARTVLEEARALRRQLEEELDAHPPADDVRAARAREASEAERHAQVRAEVETRLAAHAAARDAHAAAEAARDACARELGLQAHVDGLDALSEATSRWQRATRAWIAAADVLLARREARGEAESSLEAASARAAEAHDELRGCREELASLEVQARALRDVVGSTGAELRQDLARSVEAERGLAAEDTQLGAALLEGAQAVGACEQADTEAHAARDRAREGREEALRDYAALAEVGAFDLLDRAEGVEDLEGASPKTAVEHARALASAGPEVPQGADAVRATLEMAQNALARKLQDLQRVLVAGVRLFGHMRQGVVVYDVQYLGKTHGLAGLVEELGDDVAERMQRLALDEQELLEGFLTGELHEHVRSRIREAEALVDRMNDLLADCPTAAGQTLRLRWTVGDGASPGTREAVELLLRGARLLTAAHRDQLRAWLHERLAEAREADGAVSLRERIAGALDYRRWHAFHIEFKGGAVTDWRRLTRKSHGTGSGGEKAVMLHLPLFVAMAAHYADRPRAPRLIVLDEVFAGIDRGTRGHLMQLLVTLDLDAVLTSHDEWGFYAELDGIATYQLMRDPEVPGVYCQGFLWDGKERHDMQTAATTP